MLYVHIAFLIEAGKFSVSAGQEGAWPVPDGEGAWPVPGGEGAWPVPGGEGTWPVPDGKGAWPVPGSEGAWPVPGGEWVWSRAGFASDGEGVWPEFWVGEEACLGGEGVWSEAGDDEFRLPTLGGRTGGGLSGATPKGVGATGADRWI